MKRFSLAALTGSDRHQSHHEKRAVPHACRSRERCVRNRDWAAISRASTSHLLSSPWCRRNSVAKHMRIACSAILSYAQSVWSVPYGESRFSVMECDAHLYRQSYHGLINYCDRRLHLLRSPPTFGSRRKNFRPMVIKCLGLPPAWRSYCPSFFYLTPSVPETVQGK